MKNDNNSNNDNVNKLDSHEPIVVIVGPGTTESPHYTFQIAGGGEFTAGLSYKFTDGNNDHTEDHPLNIGTGASNDAFVAINVDDGTMPLQTEGSFTITIPADATEIRFQCNVHKTTMFGTLNVVQPSSEDTTTGGDETADTGGDTTTDTGGDTTTDTGGDTTTDTVVIQLLIRVVIQLLIRW